jgi:hypothetical protein
MLPCSAFTPYAVLLATTLVLVRREEPDSEAVCHSFAVQSNTAHMAVEHEPMSRPEWSGLFVAWCPPPLSPPRPRLGAEISLISPALIGATTGPLLNALYQLPLLHLTRLIRKRCTSDSKPYTAGIMDCFVSTVPLRGCNWKEKSTTLSRLSWKFGRHQMGRLLYTTSLSKRNTKLL